jgi:hypothetical protein
MAWATCEALVTRFTDRRFIDVSSVSQDRIAAGACVKAVGLATSAHLNNTFATVVAWNAEGPVGGRYQGDVDGDVAVFVAQPSTENARKFGADAA